MGTAAIVASVLELMSLLLPLLEKQASSVPLTPDELAAVANAHSALNQAKAHLAALNP